MIIFLFKYSFINMAPFKIIIYFYIIFTYIFFFIIFDMIAFILFQIYKKIYTNPLLIAVKNQNIEAVKLLLQRPDIDVNFIGIFIRFIYNIFICYF